MSSPATPLQLGFTSDNIAGASPEVLQAMMEAALGQAAPYGHDELTRRLNARFAELFERDVNVFLVATGTAANALGLSVLTPPWGSMLCHTASHINHDECGAPEFFTHGAHIVCIEGEDAKIDPAALRAAATLKRGDMHASQPACVSVTQATEQGSVYTLDELAAISAVCRDNRLRLHMDGARFANALVTLGCSPADMSWRLGVDVLSFGATKNGAFGVEAIVVFDPALAPEMAFRCKRAGQLLSKMRLLSAQVDAYLADDLWLRNATQANAMARRLANGLARVPGVVLMGPTESNILFCHMSQALIKALRAEGFSFYDRWGPGIVRFVTSFGTTAADVDHLLARAMQLAGSAVKAVA